MKFTILELENPQSVMKCLRKVSINTKKSIIRRSFYQPTDRGGKIHTTEDTRA